MSKKSTAEVNQHSIIGKNVGDERDSADRVEGASDISSTKNTESRTFPRSVSSKEPRISNVDQKETAKRIQKEPQRKKSQSEKITPKNKTSTNTSLKAPTGLTGSVRKSLISWFYPDVHDASENLGEGLEAHYDEKAKRWIFPGQSCRVTSHLPSFKGLAYLFKHFFAEESNMKLGVDEDGATWATWL